LADFYHIAESNMPEKAEKIDTIFLRYKILSFRGICLAHVLFLSPVCRFELLEMQATVIILFCRPEFP